MTNKFTTVISSKLTLPKSIKKDLRLYCYLLIITLNLCFGSNWSGKVLFLINTLLNLPSYKLCKNPTKTSVIIS